MNLPRLTKDTELWQGVTGRLSVYRNEKKIDEILSRLWGGLVTSLEESEGKGSKWSAGLSAKIGTLAGMLGMGEVGGQAGFERSQEKVQKHITSLTYANKLKILLDYFHTQDRFRYVNLWDGVEHVPPRDGKIEFGLWETGPLNAENDYFTGYVMGLFTPKRIVPPPKGNENPAQEILNQEKSLWEFQSMEGSVYPGSIPWIPYNFTDMSQHCIVIMAKSITPGTGIHVNAFGLVHCKDRVFTCDPISFSLYY